MEGKVLEWKRVLTVFIVSALLSCSLMILLYDVLIQILEGS